MDVVNLLTRDVHVSMTTRDLPDVYTAVVVNVFKIPRCSV